MKKSMIKVGLIISVIMACTMSVQKPVQAKALDDIKYTTADEKKARKIYKKLNKGSKKVTFTTKNCKRSVNVAAALDAMYFPDVYFASYSETIEDYGSKYTLTQKAFKKAKKKEARIRKKIKKQRTYIKKEARAICKKVCVYDNDRDNLIAIENYFVKNYTFMKTDKNARSNWLDCSKARADSYNGVYNLLKKKKGVCRHLARLYKVMCNTIGVKCDLISGDTNADGFSDHVWNIVYLNGRKIYKDITWDVCEKNGLFWTEEVSSSDFNATHVKMQKETFF